MSAQVVTQKQAIAESVMSISNETIELTCSGASSNSELSRKPEIAEDGLRRLRRVSGAIPWTIYSIAIIEMFERFSFNGTFIVCK